MKRKKLLVLFMACLLVIATATPAFAYNADVQGKPKTSEFERGGYYIWQDENGFHIRAAVAKAWAGYMAPKKHVFSGTILTEGEFYGVDMVKNERKDRAGISHDKNKISFNFATAGRDVDGIDFRIRGGRMVVLDLYLDGKRIDPKYIHLGKDASTAKQNPFIITHGEKR